MAVKYPPPSPPFIRARNQGGRQTPKAIVMHGTVSSDNAGTARNIARWWNGPTSPMSSAHYVVDPKEVIQCVGDHSIAYHVGYNTGSIGVELCDEQTGPASRWRDADSRAILARAARLVAELCLAYNIEPVRPTTAQLRAKGPHGIYGHNDSRLAFGRTTHTDPRDFDWQGFLRLVRAEIAKIKAEANGGDTGTRKDKMVPEAYFVGAKGPHVKWLAERLVKHGYKRFYKNGTDKKFTADEDRKALAAFQRSQGWKGQDANGLPGPLTLKRLAAKPKPKHKDEDPQPAPVPVPSPPAPETIKVLHAPLHGASATRSELRKALRSGASHIGFSEAWRQSAWLDRRDGWRMTTGSPNNIDPRGRQVERDVVLLSRKRFKNLESGTTKVANASTPLKIAPERHMSWTVDVVDGKPLAIIGIHPHAVVVRAWDSDRAREFRRSMRRLQALVRLLRIRYGDDLDIVILGDLNYPAVDDGRHWTPVALAKRLGLRYVNRGLDWVLYSRGLRREARTIIRDNGQDHPWIEVEFSRRPRV